ncbi:hypothetical protein [Streptomyces sp. KLOTTS4A1]|uniref:hypothetical protein n=1 Tax=Streptomyces sp. KLOTTS4A1 TaxID=3390996 RepID=UPI0039F49007
MWIRNRPSPSYIVGFTVFASVSTVAAIATWHSRASYMWLTLLGFILVLAGPRALALLPVARLTEDGLTLHSQFTGLPKLRFRWEDVESIDVMGQVTVSRGSSFHWNHVGARLKPGRERADPSDPRFRKRMEKDKDRSWYRIHERAVGNTVWYTMADPARLAEAVRRTRRGVKVNYVDDGERKFRRI